MLFAATWMDLEIIILSEVRNTKTNTIWYLMVSFCLTVSPRETSRLLQDGPHHMWNLKYGTNELIYPTEQKQTHI